MRWASGSWILKLFLSFCSISVSGFFFLSIGYFYHSDQTEESGHQPVASLCTLNFISFSHQKEADFNFLVPVLKFLEKKTSYLPTWTSQPCPLAALEFMNLVTCSEVPL